MLTLVTTDDSIQAVTARVVSVPQQARELTIVDDASYTAGGALLQTIKALRKEVDDTFDPIIKKQYEAHREACSQKKRVEAPLTEAEAIVKRSLIAYDDMQERRRQAEEARLREIARKEEEDRQVREAAELEAQASAHPDLAEAFVMRQEAEAIIDRPIETPVVQVAKATPKVEGLSFRDKWDAVVTDKLTLLRHVAQHPELLHLVDVNTTNLRKLAELQQERFALPGAQVKKDKIAASRR